MNAKTAQQIENLEKPDHRSYTDIVITPIIPIFVKYR